MHGAEFKWLLAPAAPRGNRRVRLVRTSLLTLAVGAFCAAAALLPATTLLAPATVTAATTRVVVAEPPGAVDWAVPFVRLWVILPSLLPHDR